MDIPVCAQISDDVTEISSDVISTELCTQRVNLDITAAIAMISELCHGGCHHSFKKPYLTEQAEQERQNPVRPDLERYLKDTTILMSESAHRKLEQIVYTIGGPRERERWVELRSRISVVEDVLSGRTEGLQCRGNIKEISRIVFGTGDALGATTVTSNLGFVRAAHEQGIDFEVHIHGPRALTEMKEPQAKA